MISKDQKQRFLTELEKTGNVLYSCKKTGFSKASYYRLRKSSKRFTAQTNKAIKEGKENIGDIAENALIQGIQEGKSDLIKFALKHNNKHYSSKDSSDKTIRIVYSKEQEIPENLKEAHTLADIIAKAAGIKKNNQNI
ncbi:MAG: hypothetical protein R3B41_00405 [Candidatus Doudnabacteria bacterium]